MDTPYNPTQVHFRNTLLSFSSLLDDIDGPDTQSKHDRPNISSFPHICIPRIHPSSYSSTVAVGGLEYRDRLLHSMVITRLLESLHQLHYLGW